ncbi:hypothetical protein Gogos_020661 [Gossypium gossypioides]|uniref:Non-haem dioxygenase N-terminal domain-containing protein n=1 Tax=Gossypium gossypioides TaxID=34282 RepID=A0A7J9D662_GOSGO|nr:hypothetical protein [Gossypium gossypioides]
MTGMPLFLHGVPLPKSVQEMSMNVSVPVIVLGLLPSSKDEQGKLKLALCSGGCFQAIGHGISNSFLNKVRGVAKQFFQLLQEEKQKYSRAANQVEGCGYDLVVSEKQVLDWNTRLFLRVFPEHQRKLNLWPENPDKIRHAYLTLSRRTVSYELNSCREVLHEYSIKLKQLVDLLFKAMAKSLALEENSRPDWRQSSDACQIMSNGIFKSPVHRVLTNTDKLRISVAMFNEVEPEKEIGGLIDENRPRLYRNVKIYASFNYECFQKGKVPLEEVKFHA